MDEFDKFCENYDVSVVSSSGQHARRRSNPEFFSDSINASIIRDTMTYKVEKLYTLQIPESRLRALVEMEKKFWQHPHDKGYVDMFEMLMDKEREESILRQENEAVRKAYENYSLMLHLAGHVKKI